MEQPLIETFASFADREHPKLVGALKLYCGDPSVAEDLANEAFAVVLKDWERVSGMGSPTGWLYRVAFNLTKTHYRRRKAETRAIGRLAGTAVEAYTDPDVPSRLVVRQAIASLPRRQAQVFICRHYLGMTVEETATLVGLASGTVKMYSRRAAAKLRRVIPIEEFTDG